MAESTPMDRSEMMSRIGSRNTKPEMVVRKGLHAAGFRYRLHARNLPGSPDIVLPKCRSVILVHGCFWHAHKGCRNFRLPKSNTDFWREKLVRNAERDTRQLKELQDAGWRTLVVWECATRDFSTKKLVETIAAWLHQEVQIVQIPD
ncbi:very short patch repair endonuclease [Roseovarius sp. TE539]|uniref:very short patch repair endonuclease n=1 Tax=Roseovarius sp. TE539 TaxID=2249812 RepID=UPI00215C70AF|nr:DNA mismatch endonuclease Vsr [Roseovarius sp. TE539]